MSRDKNRLIIILGDQLDLGGAALKTANPERDLIWMAEAHEESTHVWSSQLRIVQFLAAMRHFRDELKSLGYKLIYHELNDGAPESLAGLLGTDLRKLLPAEVVMTEAGDYRVAESIRICVQASGTELVVLNDEHFLDDLDSFRNWADSRKQLRLEHYYRALRQRLHILVVDRKPVGGKWSFDAENRKTFPKRGSVEIPTGLPTFSADPLTRQVMRTVALNFKNHPGNCSDFEWPVTRKDALKALDTFITERLRLFGQYQDAMWTDRPVLYHSGISAAMNLKLISPREAVDAAVKAYETGDLPLASVEGFVRQIVGWREFMHGIYWKHMPSYIDCNHLQAGEALPGFYWHGDTEMTCMRQVIHQTLNYGYAHHIQRLMVTGLFALLLAVHPREVHKWYLSVYIDAVEWVELPNTLGMSQYADGGMLASKPYVASGKYIQRMSNYCVSCRYDPAKVSGEDACPFTTLYWDFLQRHRKTFKDHPRAAMQWRNLSRLSNSELRAVRKQADTVRQSVQSIQTV